MCCAFVYGYKCCWHPLNTLRVSLSVYSNAGCQVLCALIPCAYKIPHWCYISYLIQICPTLQRSYTVKAVQKELNQSVEVVPVADGAYRPLKATLSTILAHEV